LRGFATGLEKSGAGGAPASAVRFGSVAVRVSI
jgi:hypothetical protein